jgi:hypothetical protein
MTPSTQPKLPAWIFIVTDLALLAAAAAIAANAHRPYSELTMFLIVACVIAGAVVGLVPLVANYESQKNETLDDRQRALEALARTITTSAEQISIAANGLNEISELVQKNLRHAEKLPHQLQEKIAEFSQRVAEVDSTEREELEKEVAALRSSESERLDSISDKISKATTEAAKLETAAQRRLVAATETLAKIQTDAGALDAKLAAALAALDIKIAALDTAARNISVPPAAPAPAPEAAPETVAPSTPPPAEAAPAEPAATDAPKTDRAAHPPKRPRTPRRESAPEDISAPPESTEVTPAPEVPAPSIETPAPKLEEPPPIPTAAIPEVAPVAPDSAEPFAGNIATPPAMAEIPTSPPPEPSVTEAAKAARKRTPKKTAPETADDSLTLDITETPAAESAEVGERGLSSDGATRLLVTAYIGIGNRLFIRGEGPGLSWEKGVPLQFVSIGKWRWETSDASAPVKFKLYKNDETECTALGAQSLDPGQQQEVSATF